MNHRHHLPLALGSLRAVLLFAFLLFPLAFAHAQSATATLSGTVEDQNGAVVPGAAVTVKSSSTGLSRQTTTNEAGSFTFPLLSPGSYTVRAEHDGFMVAEIDNIVLNVGDQKALRIPLKTGDIKETVNITGEAPLINESPAVGTVVDRNFAENLPLNGRSFQSLIELTPGVVLTKTSFQEQGQFSVNGQRSDANYFTVDGVSANFGVAGGAGLVQTAGGALPALAVTGGTNNLVSVDSLQEFRVQTSSFAPEFGRTTGAQVSIVTRSGTNQFHATLFEYFRNDVLDANDWFANSQRLKKAAERQNDFGGVLGGPIIRARTFFFFSYEGLRLRQPQVATSEVPSLASRQLAPMSMRPYLNAFPMPTGANTINGLAAFSGTYSQQSSLNATSLRIDHIVNKRLSLFGRYNDAPSTSTPRGVTLGFSPNTLLMSRFRTQTLTMGATLSLSQQVSNELRVNYSKARARTSGTIDGFGGATIPSDSLLFPTFATRQDSSYQFIFSGAVNAALFVGLNNDNAQRQINLVDNLSLSVRSHQFKFGVDYRRLSPIAGLAHNSIGIFFNGATGAITGNTLFAFLVTNQPRISLLFTNLSAFAQDTWKASPRLAVTYGLRWEYNTPPEVNAGNQPLAVTGFDNPATLAAAPPGTPLWRVTHNNFAPRLGIAYHLSQKSKTVLRGGIGLFYDLGTGQAGIAGSNTAPFGAIRLFFGVPYPFNPPLAGPVPLVFPPYNSVNIFDPHLKLPYSVQWNIAAQQPLGSSQSLSATYVGAIGRRLIRRAVLVNPNPTFQQVFPVDNSASSDYHALQLQFERQLVRGLQALASYTWAHSIDNASDDSTFNPSTASGKISLDTERAPSNFDVRHSFTAALTYNIPSPKPGMLVNKILRDWSTDTIFRSRTATPVNIVTGVDIFGIGSFGAQAARPDLVSGVPLYITDATVPGGRRVNRTAFLTPATPRQGTLGRNALRGFGAWQMDFTVRRQFRLTEKVHLQFRCEFFNLFNHPNFGDPVNNLRSGLFGQSIQMLGKSWASAGLNSGFNPLYQIGGPRSVQFGLKMKF